MAGCNFSGPRGIFQRIFIIAVPFLLLVQLLVNLTVPRAFRSKTGDETAFLVINIEKSGGSLSSEDSVGKIERDFGRILDRSPEEDSRLAGYDDENQFDGPQFVSLSAPTSPTTVSSSAVFGGLMLQPWASEQPSFDSELQRLVQFITKTEVNCSVVQNAKENHSDVLCINHWKGKSGCVAYSFSLDGRDAVFLDTMLHAGCEVHRFDPSSRGRSGHSGRASIKNHRAWLDWRQPRSSSHVGLMGNVQHRLVDIMDSLGHPMVDVLRMDLESAEWRMLESWIKDGTLKRINQLILTIHLQWAGFEVGGAEEEVVLFWYSVLRALRISGLHLVHLAHGPGRMVLGHKLDNFHSSYTLSWIRT